MLFLTFRSFLLILSVFIFTCSSAFPDQGKRSLTLSQETSQVTVPNSLYKGSKIYVQILCDADPPVSVSVRWKVIELKCWEESLSLRSDLLDQSDFTQSRMNRTLGFFDSKTQGPYSCSLHSLIKLDELADLKPSSAQGRTPGTASLTSRDVASLDNVLHEIPRSVASNAPAATEAAGGAAAGRHMFSSRAAGDALDGPAQSPDAAMLSAAGPMYEREIGPLQIQTSKHPVYTVEYDGVYLLQLEIRGAEAFNASVVIEMRYHDHYLSAADWPLLPFYGGMCLVYVALGVAWLAVSFWNWRDLLRIQFWIGGVILLGMLEKATFYAEYQSIDSTGVSLKGVVLFAELVSCAKRMLARMLVIIVSLGFGIVKPRLGPMLHRVVGVGTLYFVLAAVESYLRVMHQKNDQIFMASVPLAVLDSAICWWIFTSLVQTTRTLRLRRNLVKLSLYRHFTNTLVFAVISSVIFMLYSIKYHRLTQCLTDWKELWLDEAYWHMLFSVLLLVIMILWRPTNNNQRYAFTPLLDAPDDEEDEEDQFVNHAFGVKMRSTGNNSPKPKSSNSVEDDLKWVEENIPNSLADNALPIMDSDEEIMTTKFEVSKMQ